MNAECLSRHDIIDTVPLFQLNLSIERNENKKHIENDFH